MRLLKKYTLNKHVHLLTRLYGMGRCKSWTVDSGLDRGLDDGLDCGLRFGLVFG